MADTDTILEALKDVVDPEMGVNIVDLGLVYSVDSDEESGDVSIDLTLTSPGCPVGPDIIRQIKRRLLQIEDVFGVDVALVWKPFWHPSMMSESAKEEVGYDDEYGLWGR